MQKGELYINDRLVDLPVNYLVALSYAVNTLTDLKSVQGNISNSISLPNTANNRAILGYPDDMNFNGAAIIRKKLACRYVQNGVDVIPAGYVRIMGANKKTITIVVTSGNSDFFDLLKGKIRDLDFTEYDHIWNIGNVIASRLNTSGFLYPWINYGNLNNDITSINGQGIVPSEMRPAIFAKTVVEKLVASVGYKLVNRIVDDPVTNPTYQNLILPFSQDKFVHGNSYVKLYEGLNIQYEQNTQLTWEGYDNGIVVGVPFNTKIKDANNLFDGTHWTAPQLMTVDIDVNFPHIRVQRNHFVDDNIKGVYFKIYKSPAGSTDYYNPVYKIHEPQNLGIDNDTNVGDHYDFRMQVTGLSVNPGDKVTIAFETAGHENSTDVHIYATPELNIKLNSDVVQYGELVQVEAVLPDMSTLDFLKYIGFLFGAIIQADNITKTVELVPFSYILQNINDTVDWSDKVINGDEDYDVTIGDYAQENEAVYKTDDTVSPDTYGNGSFYIADENLDPYKDIYDIPFAASLESEVMGYYRTSFIGKIPPEEINNPDITGKFSISTEDRVLILNKRNVTVNYRYDYGDGAGTIFTPVSDNVPFTFFTSGDSRTDLTMKSIFANHYKDLIAVLNDQRKITCYLRLTEIDIQTLDFFRPVYIQKYAAYFYISKITDFTGVKPCKVELIKLL